MERAVYKPLPMDKMARGVVCQPPAQGAKPVRLDSPAVDTMTDLRQVAAATIRAHESLAQARRMMVARGVRLLLVVGAGGVVEGLITARDLDEKAVILLRERGGRFEDLTVTDLMVPREAIDVLGIDAVLRAEVGHVIATLKERRRQHALVVDHDRLTGEDYVRGVFSATQVGRQLGVPVVTFEVAQTFAEIEAALAK